MRLLARMTTEAPNAAEPVGSPVERPVRPLVSRLHDCAQGVDLGAEGMGWSPDPALLREAADELKRLRTENAALTPWQVRLSGGVRFHWRRTNQG